MHSVILRRWELELDRMGRPAVDGFGGVGRPAPAHMHTVILRHRSVVGSLAFGGRDTGRLGNSMAIAPGGGCRRRMSRRTGRWICV